MYVAVPSMIRSEVDRAWGVFICPRVPKLADPKRGVAAGWDLHPSPYELSEVRMTWDGRASASMPLGSKQERLTITLSLSEQLPKSASSRDEVTAVSPLLSLLYQPLGDFPTVRFPQSGDLQQGMAFSIDMQNAAGYARQQKFYHIGYVQRVEEPSPVTVILAGQPVAKDEGVCYIVGVNRGFWSEYTKQGAGSR